MASPMPKDETMEEDQPGIPHLIPNPLWRAVNSDKDLSRVLLKESAAFHAHKAMKDLLQTLKMHVDLNPACQIRIDKIESIVKRKKSFQVYIGFQGSSGAGKSTLINALIGFAKLLPSSAEQACTAVPVEVSYNFSNDPDSKFVLKVLYITKDEWRAELELLFEALAAQENAGGEDDEAEIERAALIRQTMDKIKHLYGPDIRSVDKLKTFSVEKLLSHVAVRCLLGSTKEIKTSNRQDFTAALRDYIDSGDGTRGAPTWPLVKLVKVFVKAQMLENGLTLVDLPGVGDISLARSSVAEHYQKQMSVTCILADARRAITEKNAHDLLENITKINMQLDGLYNSKSLCFVLSQIDLEFDLDQYLATHPKTNQKCSEDMKKVKITNERIANLTSERVLATKTTREDKAEAKRCTAEIVILREFLTNNPNQLDFVARQIELVDKERDLLELQNRIIQESKAVQKLAKRIHSNTNAKFCAVSSMRKRCIENRNQLCMNIIRRDYEENLAQMGRKTTDSLEVFCVAATLYLNYKTTERRKSGFPNREDTGVQELRDWLISTTFEDRETIAQSFLQEVEAFLDSNASWIQDKYGELKMTTDLRDLWEPSMLLKCDDLEEKLSQLAISSSQAIKGIIQQNLYSALPDLVNKAATNAETQVKEFMLGVTWSTHRCINRHHGHWVSSKKIKYKWNDKLSVSLKEVVRPFWNKAFLEGVPAEQSVFIEDAKNLIIACASRIAENTHALKISQALSALQDLVSRNSNLMESESKAAFAEIEGAYRKSHRRIPPAIKKFLIPMYDQCASNSGQGHYAANKALHIRTMRHKGVQMYTEGAAAVIEVVEEMLASLDRTLAKACEAPVADIREQVIRFFDENTATGPRTSSRRVQSNAKVNLQRDMMAAIGYLTEKWTMDNGRKGVVEEDVDEDADEADAFDIAELFYMKGEDDDDEYEDGSDEGELL